MRPLLLLLPFGLSLLSVRVPDIAFSACCSAPTACRGISKWQFWVFRLFDCSVYRSDSFSLSPSSAPLTVTTFHIFGIGIFVLAAHVSSSLAIFVGCICNRLIKWGEKGKGKGWLDKSANNGCDKQRGYSPDMTCKRHFKVAEFCSNQRRFFVLQSLKVYALYTLYILYIFPPPFSLQTLPRRTTWSSQQPWSSQCNLQHRHR